MLATRRAFDDWRCTGTERHHKGLLDGIDSLDEIGCFGMLVSMLVSHWWYGCVMSLPLAALTELGYGNNAVEMETTAIYDKATQEFIINTPSTLAQK